VRVASGLFNHPICSVEQRNYTPARARCAAFNTMSVVEDVRLSMTSTRHLTTGVARAEYIIFCVLENVAKLAEGRVTKAAIRTSRAYPVVVCTSLETLLPHHDTSMSAAFQSKLGIVLWSLHPGCQRQPRNPLCPSANVRNMQSDISAYT
jgi:hypothetical protein